MREDWVVLVDGDMKLICRGTYAEVRDFMINTEKEKALADAGIISREEYDKILKKQSGVD